MGPGTGDALGVLIAAYPGHPSEVNPCQCSAPDEERVLVLRTKWAVARSSLRGTRAPPARRSRRRRATR